MRGAGAAADEIVSVPTAREAPLPLPLPLLLLVSSGRWAAEEEPAGGANRFIRAIRFCSSAADSAAVVPFADARDVVVAAASAGVGLVAAAPPAAAAVAAVVPALISFGGSDSGV